MKKKNTLSLLILCFTMFSNQLIYAQCHMDDWTALKALYEAAGHTWRNTTGWEVVQSEEPPLNCNLENIHGVNLNNNGRVNSLILAYNRKSLSIDSTSTGIIPPEIGNLSALVLLDLMWNSFSGSIPAEIGNLSSLKSLNLSFNSLSGGIPVEIANLDSLTSLNLASNNYLDGNIPVELANLQLLNSLQLSSNNLSGNIPKEIGNLNSLNSLTLSNNTLTGNIPKELGNLNSLNSLTLSDNDLTGNIPPELGNLTSLKFLNLEKNQLSGSIPSQLSNLSYLHTLYLNNNLLTGNIPQGLGNLDSLVYLHLDDNKLSGGIPLELENLKNLIELELKINKLSGSIPPELSDLISLEHLDLSYNQLTGNIPKELGNMISLSELDLRNNQLNGNIPKEIGDMVRLRDLNLSNNQLNGEIPKDLNKLNFLFDLDLSSNQITGEIPAELSDLSALRHLDLADNQLTGSIPNELSSLILLTFIVNNNQLSGLVPDFAGTFGPYSTNISNNFFNCTDIENFNFNIDASSIYYFADDDPESIDTLYYDNYYSPQKYAHNAEKYFLITSENESISLSAPFNYLGNFTYQWYKNEMIVDSANDSILYLNNVQLDDVGNYYLHITESECRTDVSEGGITYISEPILVLHADLEGCTDQNSCNYNQFAMIDDGSCEYIWCDTITNPIKIRTTNEVVLSDTQIKFDLVIDSLGLDYSADGLTFNLDTRGNYRIESIEVANPLLSITEVNVNELHNSTISINRINSQRLESNEPVLSATACIVIDNVPAEEQSCSYFIISGGTALPGGHFIDFDNVYIDIPFSDCSPYGNFAAEGKNWLPLVLTSSPQNCITETPGFAEIKILQDGQSPYSYTLKNEAGEIVLEENGIYNNLIELEFLQAGNYNLIVSDSNGKQTITNTYIPLVTGFTENELCNTDCVDYIIIPNSKITGTTYTAKKEMEIKGFIDKNQTVEFGICN